MPLQSSFATFSAIKFFLQCFHELSLYLVEGGGCKVKNIIFTICLFVCLQDVEFF